jgi:hypothetical protein
VIRLDAQFWSFTNLVEAYALSALRKTHHMRLDDIRRAVRYVERELDVPHPLAARVFRTDGIELFVDEFGRLINASREGQTVMREVFEAHLKHIEYGRNGRAIRLYVTSVADAVQEGRERASGQGPKARIAALEEKIARLEALLDGHGISHD